MLDRSVVLLIVIAEGLEYLQSKVNLSQVSPAIPLYDSFIRSQTYPDWSARLIQPECAQPAPAVVFPCAHVEIVVGAVALGKDAVYYL